ncbi:MAG: iron ABC transporter permease [Clostridia bacterium]|nr:iron ABC transporter permease [Clostridia bacterium]NLS85996.1 iron ABC transporter permease [Oscillospiraceae bacterium]
MHILITRTTRKNKITLLAALIFMGAAFGASLCIGRYPFRFCDIFGADAQATQVFWQLRLPRTILAAVSGFGLACAGGVYQTVFKNPLASPDIIGVSSGASAGAAAAILFMGGGTLVTAAFAFGGGMCAVFMALLLAKASASNHLATFVLSGIAVNALAQSVLMSMKLMADPERQLSSIEFWTMGSFADATADKLPIALPAVCVGLCGIFLLHRQIMLLALDADEAKMLGVRVETLRTVVLILATLVVGGIVSVAGLISFIGLLAPHIARLLTKNNNSSTLALGGIIGAGLLLSADCLTRSISVAEIPISILTSLIGAPFLIYLICKGGKVR